MTEGKRFGPAWWLRLVGLSLLDGIVLALIPSLIDQGATVALGSIIVGTVGINYVFLSSRTYPLRWLVPGLTFLALLMIWPIIFTIWVALTNWSNGNFVEKPQAIERITTGTTYLLEGEQSQVVDLFLYKDPAIEAPQPSDVWMLVRDEAGDLFFGMPRVVTEDAPEEPVLEDLAAFDTTDEDGDGIPETIGNMVKLRLLDIGDINAFLDQLVLDIPDRGQAQVRTFSSADLAEQRFTYDEETGVLFDRLADSTCEEFEGNFYCPDLATGERLDPGWRTFIGFDNFSEFITNERIRTPFLRVFVWNVIFAAAVVFGQLAIGLGLALTFQDERMRGRRIYRSLVLVPYAAPGFIVVLVWRGLLNPSFGPVNNQLEATWLAELSNATWPRWLAVVLLGSLVIGSAFLAWRWISDRRWGPAVAWAIVGISLTYVIYKLVGPGFAVRDVGIPWVQPGNWFWSKIAVILVTVWQGFPYFFLITSGALQAIPSDLKEAARVDGASAPQVFRKVTFPLLMVGVAPLIIASFAFNFNNFVNIFLLTAGGPPVTGYAVPFGETDILISFVFDLAVESGRGGQFALAAAATFFIFFIVATISAISFRFTRRLETIYGNL
jgi:arabinogalactan oligomer/maltooligosaccharide transport system permease protein